MLTSGGKCHFPHLFVQVLSNLTLKLEGSNPKVCKGNHFMNSNILEYEPWQQKMSNPSISAESLV